uniref:peptidase domain-containing ABC transporter n=1 Tax=Scandinavium goeteborgense TaxID=1851514 RepID=UPI00135CA71C|nr:peptidase domain-containing ABC transporter [Scandinavium goeteborgense]
MSKLSVKKLIAQLNIQIRQQIPMIHQTESAECGLACLAMVCGHYGKNIDLFTLRQQFNLSARGTSLSGLISIAEQLELSTRVLSLELDETGSLKMPCILHWEFNHFVVLVNVRHNKVTLHDPARGNRIISLAEFSKSFTGIALEAWPSSKFTATTIRNRLNLSTLMGSVHGLKGALGKILCLSLVIEAINLMMPIGTQLVMDHAIPAGDRGLLTLICIGLMMFVLLRTAVGMIRSWSSMILSVLINVQWMSGLFNHLLKLPLSYFERRRLGDIQSRFSSLNTLQDTFTKSIIGALMDGIMVMGVFIMMVLYGGGLTWFVLGFTSIYVLIRLLTYRTYRQLSEDVIIKDARNKSYFMETLYGIATVKMQRMSERRGAQWLNLKIDTINSEIKVTKMDLLFGGINLFISSCEQMLILWMATSLVISNQMTIGMFIAFGAFREQFYDRVTSLVNFILLLRMTNLHNERISDIALHLQEARKPDIEILNTMRPVSLVTNNLKYSYDSQSPAIFSNLCISILPGESVAITGHSGSGKTTLMRVLCGLLEPEAGNVIVDGIDIQQLGLNNYHKMIGCVMQDDKLFSGSIQENICGFDETEDEDWMIECAKASYIHDFISEMPMGYNTLIGELGEGLSGGQRQRIFIARALYRRPGILFMDEATSLLDHESESYVNNAIKQLNITRVIIAHRLSTIASADRVINLS